MPKITKILLLAASAVLVLVIFLGVNSSGVSAASKEGDGAYRQINVYSEVLRHIQTEYVTVPNIQTVTDGALHGLLESLDPDSSYLTPSDYKMYQATGQNHGKMAQTGINISKRFGYATVVSVVPGSPADKANLNDGDIIESIEGSDTRELPLAIIERMVEGAPGSVLTVGVVRPGKAEPDKIRLNRTTVTEPPVKDQGYEDNSILYIKPEILDREHVQQVESKLKGMSKAGNKKILLDLRDVSAGDMTEATRLANDLIKNGTLATLQGQTVVKQTFTADPSKTISPTAPVVVLVNHGTAGPAELVAAAVLDDKRGDVVGEHTFGEGVEQKLFPLADGSAVVLSIAKYASPSGKKFEDEGVTPNVQVASRQDQEDAMDGDGDEQAPAPASSASPSTAPSSHPSSPAAAPQKGIKKPGVTIDEQLNKGIEILKAKTA
jgi:carboxyl-terminal processing protease